MYSTHQLPAPRDHMIILLVKNVTGLQDIPTILNFYRTHRTYLLLLHRTEHPLILSTYYYNSNVFFTKTFLRKKSRYGIHFQYMHTCQVFKTSKGVHLKQKGKIPSYLTYYQ